jgi:hypothetical protein
MCGIVGIYLSDSSSFNPALLARLLRLSQARGKEASGLAIRDSQKLQFVRCPQPAEQLMRTEAYRSMLNNIAPGPIQLIAHSRLVTNGHESQNQNNQPVYSRPWVLVHNGIVVNADELWQRWGASQRQTEVDSEVLARGLAVLPPEQRNEVLSRMEGTASLIALTANQPGWWYGSNNGSLHSLSSPKGDIQVLASEQTMLHSLQREFKDLFPQGSTFHRPELGKGIEVLGPGPAVPVQEIPSGLHAPVLPPSPQSSLNLRPFEELAARIQHRVLTLKRCTRCILPDTFPFIEFDAQGVCTHCRNHRPLQPKGAEALAQEIQKSLTTTGKGPNCLVPFSGGRDSSYALHYLVKELGLKPLAFSYDWGLLTDLARRNQARMCGALGVEHILVSADIRAKRANVRRNVSAWLRRPRLGTIPLFMAGDKQYFYHTQRLLRAYGLTISVMGENLLETTRFKTAYAGIPPRFGEENTYQLPGVDKLKMLLYYGKETVLNPAYINASMVDTLGAFASYYGLRHSNLNIFDYLPWQEEPMIELLRGSYDWEVDPETPTTWRIGDGTAAFYNFIYWRVAGFTENDTFRSNQIREGQLSREQALSKAMAENLPRWAGLQWYCSTIGLDTERVLRVIAGMPARFSENNSTE